MSEPITIGELEGLISKIHSNEGYVIVDIFGHPTELKYKNGGGGAFDATVRVDDVYVGTVRVMNDFSEKSKKREWNYRSATIRLIKKLETYLTEKTLREVEG